MSETIDSSRALIADILAGNQSAFQTFVEQYQRLVAHIVFRMVPERADREDVCQNVFIKAYRNLGGFEFASKVSTWIARIAYNTAVNYLQKKKILLLDDLGGASDGPSLTELAVDPAESAAAVLERRDSFGRVQKEMNHLPPQFRALLTLYHLDEMTYEEIADVTGLPMGTVKNYLFRARRMLKDRLLKKYRLEDIWHQGT